MPVHLPRDLRANAAHGIKRVADGLAASTVTRVNDRTQAGASEQTGAQLEGAWEVSRIFYAYAADVLC